MAVRTDRATFHRGDRDWVGVLPAETIPVLELEALAVPDRVALREAVQDKRTVPAVRMEFPLGAAQAPVRWVEVHRMRRCCR